ncbi:MAG TPA: molybdenum ABC transporter ATP-binding protein [Pyrinomonadaceae bacterium]|nr:molybdenum ABC transporter ATP-binding protein [Pyrinomonadaceae bacterium]
MLSVRIRKRLGDARHVEAFTLDVEFDARAGVTILFGPSGAGKSLTLRSVAGLVRPDEGRIVVEGRALFDSERGVNLPIRERRVGYVFQNLALFPHLSARANVEFALARRPRRERRERADALLESLRILHAAERRPREISGGEAQRVALARALASDPQLLLLDEPLSALDEPVKHDIIEDLRALNRRLRLPVLYVTHSREEAVALGERVLVFERGRVAAAGEPLEVFGAPVSAGVARLTGVENVFAARVTARNEAAGMTTVEVGAGVEDGGGTCRVEVPLGRAVAGARVTLAVRAGDILLATEEPRSTSARNVLRARVTSVEETGRQVRVRARAGVEWTASVTPQSAKELQLSAGKEVWLAFKTYSCHLLESPES